MTLEDNHISMSRCIIGLLLCGSRDMNLNIHLNFKVHAMIYLYKEIRATQQMLQQYRRKEAVRITSTTHNEKKIIGILTQPKVVFICVVTPIYRCKIPMNLPFMSTFNHS